MGKLRLVAGTLIAGPLLVLLWVGHIAAEETRTIAVQGTGKASALPDMVEVSASSISRAQHVATALAENNEKIAMILALVAKSGIAERDVRTGAFYLTPIFDEDEDGSRLHAVVGYEVSNDVSITLRDTGTLGVFLDKLASAGADRIQYIRFSVSDRAKLLQAARRGAVADARAKAALYADELGVALGHVVDLTEGGRWSSPPVYGEVSYSGVASAVPVAPGLIDFRATVTMRFAIVLSD